MAVVLLRLLPLILLAVLIWLRFTAASRTTRVLRRQSRVLKDPQVTEMTKRFSDALEAPTFDVRILDWRQVNGVATPDGEIYITRGLYEKYLDRDVTLQELGAVIAHEIGHVALGHAKQRLADISVSTATWAGILAVWLRAIFGWIVLIGALIWRLFRTQKRVDAEFEADAFSVQLMARSGYDPGAVVDMLRKVDELTGGASPKNPTIAWLYGVPTFEARIDRAEKVVADERRRTPALT